MDHFDEIVDRYSIALPIVTEKVPKPRKIMTYVLVFFLILTVIGIVGTARDEKHESILFIIFLIVGVIGNMLVGIFIKLFRPHVNSGNVTISMRHIKVEKAGVHLDIPMAEIESIHFINKGYQGQLYYSQAMGAMYEGDDNRLSFTHKNKEYDFRVFVENKQQQHFLSAWIEHCQKLGVMAEISNKDGFFLRGV